MHKYLLYAAYGWLALSGALHFVVDVAMQYLRAKRVPSAETTLYYGLNTAFSLGQVAFGLLGLWVARHAMGLLTQPPAMVLALSAAFAWLAITFFFMAYWEPKMNVGIFCVLLIAAFCTAP